VRRNEAAAALDGAGEDEQAALSSPPMSDGKKAEPRFGKGDRAAIVAGKRDVGVRGAVFWIGPNKYGEGMRYGLRGDDGATYWVDESQVGPEAGAPPAPERPAREALSKGDRVKITSGREGVGTTGEIFWVGDSKFGVGLRYGVRVSEDETYWVDEAHVELVEKGEGGGGGRRASRGSDATPPPKRTQAAAGETPPPVDDEGWPSDDDYAAPDDDEIPF
jgi:hypothetical protein